MTQRSGELSQRFSPRNVEHVLSSMKKYTRFVSLSKISLAGVSFVMLAVIVILPLVAGDKDGLRIAFDAATEQSISLPMMTNPRYQGTDEKGQRFTITADNAIQSEESTIVLNQLQADIFMTDKSWMMVSSKAGTYDRESSKLVLNDDVMLYHDTGYEFYTDEAQVDLNASQALGTKPVSGQGPMGTIRADRYAILGGGDTLQFEGNVLLKVRVQ